MRRKRVSCFCAPPRFRPALGPVTKWSLTRSMKLGAGFLALFVVLLAACANHFHNSFHFDDFHTITQNPDPQCRSGAALFRRSARTFSILSDPLLVPSAGHSFARARLLAKQGAKPALVSRLHILLVRRFAQACTTQRSV